MPGRWRRPGLREQRVDHGLPGRVRTAGEHLAARVAGGLNEIGAWIVRVAPAIDVEVAFALEHALTLGPVETEHDVALVVGAVHAHERADVAFLAVALLGDARLRVDVESLEIFLQHEVHHAGDGIGAVHRRRSAGDDFDALNRRGGNRVDVDDEQGVRGLRTAAVDEDQIAIGAEATQVQRRGARRLGGACLRAGDELIVAWNELRKLLQHRFNRSRR